MKLPLNCVAEYYKDFLSTEEASNLFSELSQLVQDTSFSPQTINGEVYQVNFGKIMFMDQELLNQNKFPEKQWGPTRSWTQDLAAVKNKIEALTQQEFQTCVLIYYPDGQSGVDYHSDYVAFGDTSTIPSISLGEEREFKLREKASLDEYAIQLAHGSLIIMGKNCQERYEHSLPTNPIYTKPRINLTFRKYGFK
jgi:alkylated DNA repair dioxygenase AlkB